MDVTYVWKLIKKKQSRPVCPVWGVYTILGAGGISEVSVFLCDITKDSTHNLKSEASEKNQRRAVPVSEEFTGF